jgi:hypothetical protein
MENIRGDRSMTRQRLAILVAVVLMGVGVFATDTKDKAYTTQQIGAALWTPGAGRRIAVNSVDIQCGGTTAGTITLWFGAAGDTTFTQDTDQPVTYMDCGTPSATSAPGKVVVYAEPAVKAVSADYVLRVTTSAALTVRVIVHGYEL